MSSPSLWILLAAGFIAAALLNAARAVGDHTPRRPVRLVLAGSCLAWAASALALRFLGMGAAIACAVVAAGAMLWSAILSANPGPTRPTP